MGRTRLAIATATCAFFAGCYMTEGPSLDEAAHKTKDASASDAVWPSFGDAAEGFDGGGGSFFQNTQPTFGATTSAADAPPPISGGTLLVTRDGTRAIASDPDRDLVYIVDLAKNEVLVRVSLVKGDEPGRLVEDGAGRVHVALRGGGALVTIDGATGAVLARRAACPSPRGVDWDSTSDNVWLACATGELVAFPAAGGNAVARWVVERRSSRRGRFEWRDRGDELPRGAKCFGSPAATSRVRDPTPVAVVVDVAARRVALRRHAVGRVRDGAPSGDDGRRAAAAGRLR